MKDFLGLRPVYHYTDRRVAGHIAICVFVAVIEAVTADLLDTAKVADPDIDGQTITPRRALAELNRTRTNHLTASGNNIYVTTRPNALQAEILEALDIDTHAWNNPTITSHPT
ncbi:MAG: hypothetical protein GY708_26210 [Actinomycetia bacterium]|nr:hypothetical protein [Actinomycetes bacterium]MCP4967466.1 hypothetical protein [bacterium]